MATTSKRKTHNSGILVDGDRLGFTVAVLVGTVVMALGFFHYQLDGFAVAIRVGITSVIAYTAVFLFVHFVLHTVMKEIAEERLTQAGGPGAHGSNAEGPGGSEKSGDNE